MTGALEHRSDNGISSNSSLASCRKISFILALRSAKLGHSISGSATIYEVKIASNKSDFSFWIFSESSSSSAIRRKTPRHGSITQT